MTKLEFLKEVRRLFLQGMGPFLCPVLMTVQNQHDPGYAVYMQVRADLKDLRSRDGNFWWFNYKERLQALDTLLERYEKEFSNNIKP